MQGTEAADREMTLRVLLAEYAHLESSLAMTWNLSMTRTTQFIMVLSGSAVALALAAQVSQYGRGLVEFAIVILPMALYFGLATFVRVLQANREATVYAVGLNRIRNGLSELAPGAAPYMTLSIHDDETGIYSVFEGGPGARWSHRVPWWHAVVTIPGVVAVLDAIVAGLIGGAAAVALGGTSDQAFVAAVAAAVVLLAILVRAGARSVQKLRRALPPRFPTPEPDGREAAYPATAGPGL